MIQIAFCDDDQTVLDQLSALLEKYRAQRCVQIQCTAFHSPLDLLAEIEKGTRYDILFLDVIMPAENGITAAKEIRQYDNVVKIIFLTSSAEFAVESYVVGAYFYQIKPIWEDSFFRLTDSVIAECRRADQRSLILRCKTGISRIDLDQLLYCEVLGRTLLFHLVDGTVLESTGSMDELARQLTPHESFLRTHRSFLPEHLHPRRYSDNPCADPHSARQVRGDPAAVSGICLPPKAGDDMSTPFADALSLCNLASVGIFGIVLSAAFCELEWTRQRKFLLVVSTVLMLALQGVVSLRWSTSFARYLYPVITHLPLVILLVAMTRKALWSLIAVLTAYLCCQLRRWAALLVIALFPTGGTALQDATELVVTLPLLLALVHWIAPSVRALSHSSLKLQLQFGVIPLLSYVFDYFTRIYTDLLSSGNQAAVEFMPFVCSLAYLAFVLQTTQEQKRRSQLEQTQNSLNLQVAQAVREIDALRESQRKASTYRHDLRHHLQYISACIENGRAEAAQEYIHSVCAEIEASKVNVYCENEAANLILSAFATRAQNSGIDFRVHAAIPLVLPLPDSDLCVLLSNALENALHAGQRQREAGKPAVVETTAYQKDGRLFLQIANSCSFPVQFRAEGIPTTSQPGHGLGVRSICAIVEQYGGMYSFSQQQNQFVLRISL